MSSIITELHTLARIATVFNCRLAVHSSEWILKSKFKRKCFLISASVGFFVGYLILKGSIMTRIQIGHSAYSGVNAMSVVKSKAAAVRELRKRGILRDNARKAVNQACSKMFGYATVRADGFDVIEVLNDSRVY